MHSDYEARRMTKTYRQVIDAAPDVVFPLLCPVRELEWLDGWAYRMIYSESGLAEPGAVFATSVPGEADTIWIVSRHDAVQRVVEFSRFTADSRTCLLRIAVSPIGVGRSSVDVSYEYTALTPAGATFLDAWSDAAFIDGMRFWEDSMNHFLKTGTRLKHQSARHAAAHDGHA